LRLCGSPSVSLVYLAYEAKKPLRAVVEDKGIEAAWLIQQFARSTTVGITSSGFIART